LQYLTPSGCIRERRLNGDFLMFRNAIFGFFLFAFLSSAFAANEPGIDQVYKAAQSGRMDEAQRMMDVVLKAHPNSAKAHFVEAELLARQGQLDQADAQLSRAERLKPGLSFASPQAVQDLKRRIAAVHHISLSQPDRLPVAQGYGFPWGMLLIGGGVIALLFFAMRAFSSRRITQDRYRSIAGMQQAGAVPAQSYQPYGAGMGSMAATGSGIGSGIMGGLATGAAAGVGMVAGEALAHHFMDGGREAPKADSWSGSPDIQSSDNMGGLDFGVADNFSWDDNSNVASADDVGSDWN
jgi:hypothetical protein